jgi:hypothetical protein
MFSACYRVFFAALAIARHAHTSIKPYGGHAPGMAAQRGYLASSSLCSRQLFGGIGGPTIERRVAWFRTRRRPDDAAIHVKLYGFVDLVTNHRREKDIFARAPV